MKRFWLLALMLLCFQWSVPCAGQGYTRDGAVVGGLTGAGIGAVIGDNNDETAAGALIGGAIGAITGGMLGNNRDQRVVQDAIAYRNQQAYQMSRAITMNDVVVLSQTGLSDQVIINRVRSHGLQRPLEIADIVHLSQQGVSDRVILAMQQAAEPMSYAAPAPAATPIVVERYQMAPRPAVIHVAPRPRPPHCYYPGPRRNTARFSVTFGR